jgi:predicted DNA-binding transcriptional regulator YafY
VQAEMDGGYGIYAGGQRQWATLAFEPQAAQWVSKEEWHPEQQTHWLEGGGYELAVPYTEETEILMDILRHGDQVRVLEPPALVAAVRARLAAAAARY